ncbi:MAG: hypothetical protein FWE95_00145 [Planctomycetaceae bacterium]|nr:hypothetical protein [Planctomycetaceae bacterium]
MPTKTISGYSGALSLRSKGDYGIGVVGESRIVSTLQNWNLSYNVAVQEKFASNTGRFGVQMAGIKSFQGSYSRYATVPLEELGKTYLFNGYAGHTVKQNNIQRGLHYRGSVLITGLEVTYNWESRDANAYTTNFISNWCEDGDELKVVEEAALLDTPSAANPRTFMQPGKNGIRVQKLNDSGQPVGDWANLCVKNCTLSFSIQPIIENNSCSGEYQHVLEGGNISCGINATVSSSNFDDVADIGSNLLMRIYPSICDPGAFWEFCALTNVSMSNLNVDVEGGGAVSFTLQGKYNINPGFCSTVLGYIVDPMNRYWAGAAAA